MAMYLHNAGMDDSDSSSDDELIFSMDEHPKKTQSSSIRRVKCHSTQLLNPSPISSPTKKSSKLKNSTLTLRQSKRKIGPSSFDFLKQIGEGGYGTVYLAKDRKEKTICAMKVLTKATLSKSQKDVIHTVSELKILQQTDSPFICKLLHSFQTVNKLYLALQFCGGGDLFTHMDRVGVFGEADARFYAGELTLALEHLHSRGIMYRDLKPENILLDVKGHVVLADFGLSKPQMLGSRTYTMCGTYEYMAPEVVSRVGHSVEIDWYALGALLYDMTAGRPPFKGESKKHTMELILRGRPAYLMYLSQDFNDFLQGLLTKVVDRRLGSSSFGGVSKIKSHKWFKGVNWDDIENRTIKPPIVPTVTSPEDVCNFDPSFTTKVVRPECIADAPMQTSSVFDGFDWAAEEEEEEEELTMEESDNEGELVERRSFNSRPLAASLATALHHGRGVRPSKQPAAEQKTPITITLAHKHFAPLRAINNQVIKRAPAHTHCIGSLPTYITHRLSR
eukprot:m.33064 g.33064  ORF g.33064 m.33064 type:complete len:505 (+) comp16752_c0_seq2:361-1875(+)